MNRLAERDQSPSPQNEYSSDEDTEDASEAEEEARLEADARGGKANTFEERLRGLQSQLDKLEREKWREGSGLTTQDCHSPGEDMEYLRCVKDLEAVRDNRIFTAETWMLCEIDCMEREYEREMEQAQEEFDTKKQELKECIVADLQEKQRVAEQEKTSLDLAVELTDTKPMTTRKLRSLKRYHDSLPTQDKKRKTTTLSSLMYLLNDEEISDDLHTIFKGRGHHFVPRAPHLQIGTGSDGGSHEARVEDGKLYYDRKWFHKGQHIMLESVEHGQECGVITTISLNELWIACLPDHSKLRVNLTQLKTGKYILKRRSA